MFPFVADGFGDFDERENVLFIYILIEDCVVSEDKGVSLDREMYRF